MSIIVDKVNHLAADLPMAICDEIHALRQMLRRERYRIIGAGPRELTHLEGRIIGFLARETHTRQSDLVAFLARDKAQIARMVAALRADGFVTSDADPDDRRQQRLALTAQGRDLFENVREARAQAARHAVRDLGESDRRQLYALLLDMRASLAKPADTPL